jgi:branched-chain amino acid transport system substrate-binding protein
VARLPAPAAALTIALLAVLSTGCGQRARARALPESFCSKVFYKGERSPQYLIASDLPLKAFDHPEQTRGMVAGIRYALRQHAFKAGKYRVGYQACDDSNPQRPAGDLTRCSANAKAYARNKSVLGIVGTWNSACSAIEIPILNKASGGPLVLVSPSNTGPGLTHAAAGVETGEPERYYPSGKRNFVRLMSPDDFGGAADAWLAKKLGLRSVFLLNDRESYGLGVAAAFQDAARKLGVRIRGVGSWEAEGSPASLRAVAGRVKRSGADGVFLGGFNCTNCAALLQALAGPHETIIAPDGFYSIEDVTKTAGPAATEGMYVSVPGTTGSGLSPVGRRLATRFGPVGPGAGGAPYAAQATELLLDAIGQSDGSRASVTKEVFSTNVEKGILGSFGFDRNGDTTANPFTIYVGRDGKSVLDRVVTPPHTLASPGAS